MTRNGISATRGARGGRRRAWALAIALTAIAAGGRAEAQCAGDCNGDNMVAINELIVGVNIALGTAQIDACPSFDRNGNGGVEINELIGAVNNALGTCPPPLDTPTATPSEPADTPTPTPTVGDPTPTPTATVAADTPTPTATVEPGLCGNGTVNFDAGETCDDGNTAEGVGDICPSDCRIEPCELSGERFTLDVVFTTTDENLLLGGLTVLLTYPYGTATVPGTAGDAAVLANVTSDVFAVTPNDQEYSLVVLMIDPLSIGYPSGTTAAGATFEVCSGAARPPLDAFGCDVTDAIDLEFNTVTDQVACAVSLR